MSQPTLIVLGTASQVPTRQRNHNGYFLQWEGEGFLFDPGEGIQRQMIHFGLAASQITKILITHFHGDHCLGLAGIIQRLSLDQVSHPVDIWFPASGTEFFEKMRHLSIFHDCSNLRPHPIDGPGPIFQDEHFQIVAARLEHSVDTYGYRIVEKDRVSLLPDKLAWHKISGPEAGRLKKQGYLDRENRRVLLDEVSRLKPGRKMAFVMDTRPCQGALDLAQSVDLLVCESTYLQTESQLAHDHFHMTATQAARLACDACSRKLVLTHFSQRYQDVDLFLQEARPVHAQVVVAFDGDRISFPE